MQFVFTGRVELNGCQFIVEAESEEAAREKIGRGEWTEVETGTAEFTQWTVIKLMSKSVD